MALLLEGLKRASSDEKHWFYISIYGKQLDEKNNKI